MTAAATTTTTTPGSGLQFDLWLDLDPFPVALSLTQAGHGAAQFVAGIVAQEDIEERVQEGVEAGEAIADTVVEVKRAL